MHETQQVAGTGVRLCYFLWLLSLTRMTGCAEVDAADIRYGGRGSGVAKRVTET